MRRDNRPVYLGVAVATFIASGFLISSESRCQRQQNASAAQPAKGMSHSGRYQFVSQRSWMPCLVERSIANPPSKDGSDKEQRDLIAQEASALWSFWIAVFALLQAIATIGGLIFIARTLEATRESVHEASEATKAAQASVAETRRIGEAQVRSYLSIRDIEATREKDCLTIQASVLNSGQSPAYIQYVEYNVLPRNNEEVVKRSAGQEEIGADTTTKVSPCYILIDSEHAQTLVINIEIVYQDVFDIAWSARASFAGPKRWTDGISEGFAPCSHVASAIEMLGAERVLAGEVVAKSRGSKRGKRAGKPPPGNN